MIKFFRKIRLNLLNEGKTTKYFKYAIGEILLVVIGILIALQINNWNENQKNKVKIKALFAEVLNDIEQDIAAIDGTINALSLRDSIGDLILDKSYSFEEVKDFEHGELNTFFSMTEYFGQSNNGYNSLMSVIDNVPIEYTSTLKNLKPLYNFKNKETYDAMESLKSLEDELKKQLAFNQPWYHDVLAGKPNKEAFEFIEDPMHRNMVALYQDRIKSYKIRLLVLKLASIVSYAEVQDAVFPDQPKPSFIPIHATAISNTELDKFVGCYSDGTRKLKIERKGNYLTIGERGSGSLLFVTNKEGNFTCKFSKDFTVIIVFERDDKNNIINMKMETVEIGSMFKYVKIKDCD